MENPKAQLADRLRTASNILVTVSRNPSVDQLSALLGLTLLLNKQGKHAAAVFSGQVPSTIEFLKPEETIETNTDSLRDFIIALDKGKADKLRYKVEDDVVRIFITPYKTSISQADLEFSQGDFNVDVVVALGVQRQEDLDEAITAHGRILHDATLASINTASDGGLGSINWNDPQASSLSELVTELGQSLGDNLFDTQIATALLTGIVAETARFSNQKTSAHTMQAGATLMAAGANQQLVAEQLEAPAAPETDVTESSDSGDSTAANQPGTLEIDHHQVEAVAEDLSLPEVPDTSAPAEEPETPAEAPEPPAEPASNISAGASLITEPPTLGGDLTANAKPEQLDPVTDPLSLPANEQPLLSRSSGPAADTQPVADERTLTELETSVHSPHLDPGQASEAEVPPETPPSLDAVRDEITRALNDAPSVAPPQPIQALNAQPVVENLNSSTDTQPAAGPPPMAEIGQVIVTGSQDVLEAPAITDSEQPSGAPSNTAFSATTEPGPAPGSSDPAALSQTNNPKVPPVPPPIPFQFGAPPTQQTAPPQSPQ